MSCSHSRFSDLAKKVLEKSKDDIDPEEAEKLLDM